MVEEEDVEGAAGAPFSSVFLVAEEEDDMLLFVALGHWDRWALIGRRRVDPVGASVAVVGFDDSPTKSVGLKFCAYGVARVGG